MRHAQATLIGSLIICAVLIPLAMRATQNTVPDGWLSNSAPAVQVQELIGEQFGRSDTTYYLLFSDPTGELSASDQAFLEQVQYTVRPLRALDDVQSVLTWGTTSNDLLNSMLISDDGSSSLAVITLRHTPEGEVGSPDWIREHLNESDLEWQMTGLPVVGEDFRVVGHNDLVRAELIALPITLILLVIIFRGIVPALIPVVLAACSMIVTLAAMAVLANFAPVSVFTVNTVTMLGLAVGIDYALIMVSRFREEMSNGSLLTALESTLTTAGKTVVTAATTVAIGLSGLLFFDVPAATTTALLGALVVLVAMLLSLVAVPAALVVYAKRVVANRNPTRTAGFLSRIESIRERHPGATFVACLIVLALLTLPVVNLNAVSPGLNNLPASAESRTTAEQIQGDFPLASTSPVEIVIQPTRGSMLDSSNLQRYQELTNRIAGVEGVLRTESIWNYIPAGIAPRSLSTSFVLEPNLIVASQPYLTPAAALITVIPDTKLSSAESHDLVNQLRDDFESNPIRGLEIMVGGSIGLDLDLLDHIAERTPIVLAWVIVLTAIVLFVHLRSALLPIKALAMNLISMGASFGLLVWVFQEGNLARLVGAEANGTTVMLLPVLMFSFLFGLGMDFEIIMLSRIREAWQKHGDTTLAVREGLDQAAGIVTASAVLMLTVFLAFAFSELDIVKALGIGLAFAVLIDATIVRLLLLPATMQLMGNWNWWPSRFKRNQGGEHQ